jgi:hypothetical protein
MTEPRDPERLIEAESTPAKLRSWLVSAHADTPPVEQVLDIVRAVEHLAQSEAVPRLEPDRAAEVATPGKSAGPFARGGFLSAKGVTMLSSLALLATLGALLARRHAPEPAALATAPAGDRVPGSVTKQVGAEKVGAETTGPVPSGPLDAVTSVPEDTAVVDPPRAVASSSRSRGLSGSTPRASIDTDGARLLRSARRLLPAHPDQALALTQEHARRFPTGMLTQEREALAVECLAELGRTGEAKTRARHFLDAFPASPYRSRIDAVLRGRGLDERP